MSKDTFQQKENIICREINKNFVLVPIRKTPEELESLFSLNETAGFIWNLLEKKTSTEDIVNRLTEAFDTDKEQAIKDVTEFIVILEKKGLVARDA